MNTSFLITAFSQTIEKWNDKLNSIASEYMNSPFFGALVVIVIFAFGCWAISYLTKK